MLDPKTNLPPLLDNYKNMINMEHLPYDINIGMAAKILKERNIEITKKNAKQIMELTKQSNNLTRSEAIQIHIEYLNELRDGGGCCENCGAKDDLTLDHIIPQCLLKNLCIDVEKTFDKKNLQLYCKRCNGFKGDKLDFANPKTKKLLLGYINTI